MSEPRLISPMLDHYALGGAISNHSGVSCYPAMRADSDERYIVKTISIPASQGQLEALLLTGAYPNAEAARVYFQELAKGVRSEIEILDKLAARRGFLPFLDSQIVPMEEGVGYEVYLLSYYKRTLERHLKKEPLTHLSAVNLGIDLCAALKACREMGYLYVDLKPGNIFINTVSQSYHLGDLGFVSLDSLKYASLPDRYRSDYTAPEISDAFATLNTTMDTYALGLVLYQIYNNAQLPFDSAESRAALMAQLAAGEPLAAPAYADYEMAEIICKACAYNPEDRWQTPEEMAEALISYMKRNGANDVPIAPPVIPEMPQIPAEEPQMVSEDEADGTPVDETDETPDDEADAPSDDETGDASDDEADDISEDETFDTSGKKPDEAPTGEGDSDDPDTPPAADWIDRMHAILAEDSDEGSSDETADDEPSLRELLQNDDRFTPVASGDENLNTDDLSDETASFLSQVQDLIDHEAPAPAVAPEPIDIPIPAPIVSKEPTSEDDALLLARNDLFQTDDEEEDEEDGEDFEEDDEDDVEELTPRKSKTWKRILTVIILLLLLAGAAFAGYYYYQNYYLQTIESITVDGGADTLTVTVVTDMDQSLLTVVCKDTYGNVETAKLVNGQATFAKLQPGSQYMISLEVSGFHELVNASPASYSTPERTQIVDLNAITGAEDGSVILSFGVEGPESAEWTLTCAAEGEEDKVFTFSGHSYTVVGLTPFTTYTFTLTGGEDVYLIGENSLAYTVSTVIYAQNLTVTGYRDTSMTIGWEAPEGVAVNSWTVRCYNEDGYDQVLVVDKPSATFTEISASSPYTLEITAEGMTQSMRTFITANPVTITDIDVTVTDFEIHISWTYEGNAPKSGWLVLYTVDKGTEPQVIESDAPFVTIAPAAPGSHYDITIQSADATSVFNGTAMANVPAASGDFSGYELKSSDVEISLYRAPDGAWTRKDLKADAKTTTFGSDSAVALVYYTDNVYKLSDDPITTLIVVRDSEGRLAAISSSTRSWDDMWENGYCVEELSHLPATAGDYTLSIYLNGKLLANRNITVTE